MSVAACFGEPPIVGDTDPGTSGGGMATTTSEPIVEESGEAESDHTTSTSPGSTSSESGDSGDESGTAGSGEGPETTTDDGSSDGGSSTGAEATWTCSWDYYGTFDGCDCGCGIVDPDCVDSTVESCEYCSNPGSCSTETTCVGYIDPDNNAVCID